MEKENDRRMGEKMSEADNDNERKSEDNNDTNAV
jgi:hypothetical protein